MARTSLSEEETREGTARSEGMAARMRRLGMNSGIYLGGNVLAQGLSILLFPLYTRYLTPVDYGIIGITATVLAVVKPLIGFGITPAVSRLYFEADSEEQRRRLYGTAFAFIVVCPGALALGLHLAGHAGALDLFPSAPYVPYLQYAIAVAYLAIFMDLPIFVYQAQQRPGRVLLLTGLNAALTAGFTVLLVVGLGEGALGALRAWLIAAGIMAVIAVVLMVRMSSFRLSRRWLFAGLAFGIPFVPHLIGNWVLQLSDRMILDQYVTSAQLGIYTLGATVGGAALFLAHSMGRAFAPQLTLSLKHEREHREVPEVGTYWVLALSWGTVAIALFATEAVTLLAPSDFHEAVEVIPWIVAGYFAFGLYQVASQGTWFAMKTRWIPIVTLTAAAFNIGLNLLLIPRYGIIGAAVASLAAYSLLAVLMGWVSSRLYRIPWELGRWSILVLAWIATFATGSLVEPNQAVLDLVVKGVAVTVIFFGIVTISGFWTPREIAFIRDRVSRIRGASRRSRAAGL